MANLTDEQVAEFKVRRLDHSQPRVQQAACGAGVGSGTDEERPAAEQHARLPIFDAPRPSPLLSVLFRSLFENLLWSLLLSLVGGNQRSRTSLSSHMRITLVQGVERRSLEGDEIQETPPHRCSRSPRSRPLPTLSNSYLKTGGLRPLRQGRRRDHHDQRARHRHALSGPEPDGGGAAGEGKEEEEEEEKKKR